MDFVGVWGGLALASPKAAKVPAFMPTRLVTYAGTFTALEEAVSGEVGEVSRAATSLIEVTTNPIGRRQGRAAATGAVAFPPAKMVRRVFLAASGSIVGTTEVVVYAATTAFCRSRATMPVICVGLHGGDHRVAPSEERPLHEAASAA